MELYEPEFDHPFRVNEDGTVEDALGVYAPPVWNDEDSDIEIDGAGWEPLTGWTYQDRYSGAVMHASETFGGMHDHVMSTPGVYTLVVVNVWPTDEDDDPEPAGWACLRKV